MYTFNHQGSDMIYMHILCQMMVDLEKKINHIAQSYYVKHSPRKLM